MNKYRRMSGIRKSDRMQNERKRDQVGVRKGVGDIMNENTHEKNECKQDSEECLRAN